MNRVFGSPYTLTFHQEVHLLRHKKLPYKLHSKSAFNAGLHRVYRGAPSSFCALADLTTKNMSTSSSSSSSMPATTSSWRNPFHLLSTKNRLDSAVPIPLFHQLLETFEDGAAPPSTSASASIPDAGTPTTTTTSSTDELVNMCCCNPSVLIDPFKYPKKNLVAWSLMLYGATNLGQIGSMFRWIHGGGSNVVEGYIQFLSKATAVIPGLLSVLRNKVRDLMRMTLREIGLGEELEPYMMNHFWRMCNALEQHCAAMEAKRGVGTCYYLLDTTHPTIADIAFGSVFEAYFLMDDPPATEIMEGYPAVYRYIQNMMKTTTNPPSSTTSSSAGASEGQADTPPITPSGRGGTPLECDNDDIPPTILPLLTLALEVLPLHVSQCDAMRLFAHSLLTGASTGGGEVQEVCDIDLEQVRRTVMGFGMEEEELCSASATPATSSIKGYVVKPKLAEGSWTVIADSSIITSCTKVQEVELAQLAAQGAMGLYPRFIGPPSSPSRTTTVPYIDTMALCGQHIFREAGIAAPTVLCTARNYEELVDQVLQPPEVNIDFYAHKLTSPTAVAPTNVSFNSGAAPKLDQQTVLEKRIMARTRELHSCCAISMDVANNEDVVSSSSAISADSSSSDESPTKRRTAKTVQSEDLFVGSTSSNKASYPDVRSDDITPGGGAVKNRKNIGSGVGEVVSSSSSIILQDDLSMEDTLFALSVLLQRMIIPEVEVRSLFRKQTVSFALVPRKKWWK